MNSKLTKVVVALAIALIGFMGVSCTKKTGEKKAEPVQTPVKTLSAEQYKKTIEASKKVIVAKVDGTEITLKDLLEKMNALGPQYIKDPSKRTPEIEKKVREEALDILIFRELAFQDAVKRGIKPDQEAVAAHFEQFKKSSPSEKEYREHLAMSGLDEAALKRQFSRNELIDEILVREIFDKVKKGDRNAIEKRKQEWENELRSRAKIEIINTPDAQNIIPAERLKVTN